MMLSGKVVVVAGGGRGIGRGIALLCASEGASVIVNDPGVELDGTGWDAKPAKETVEQIKDAGGKAYANFGDITNRAASLGIIEDALSQFGRIDAVVNAAGLLRNSSWHDLSRDDWDAVLDVHLNGAFNICRAATPHFRGQKSGSFVHFTSGSVLHGSHGQANYAAANLGVVGLSQAISVDMARFGTRSNCIAPMAWTRMTEASLAEGEQDDLWAEVLKSMGAEKVAPLAAYLVSDASKDVSGQFFGAYGDKIDLYSKPIPIRTISRDEGWSVKTIAEELIPAFRKEMVIPEPRPGDLIADETSFDQLDQ